MLCLNWSQVWVVNIAVCVAENSFIWLIHAVIFYFFSSCAVGKQLQLHFYHMGFSVLGPKSICRKTQADAIRFVQCKYCSLGLVQIWHGSSSAALTPTDESVKRVWPWVEGQHQRREMERGVYYLFCSSDELSHECIFKLHVYILSVNRMQSQTRSNTQRAPSVRAHATSARTKQFPRSHFTLFTSFIYISHKSNNLFM